MDCLVAQGVVATALKRARSHAALRRWVVLLEVEMCSLLVAVFTKILGVLVSAFTDLILYLQRAVAVLGLLGFLQRPRVGLEGV